MSDNVSAAHVCSRALALLTEARQMLQKLVESGEVEKGSPPEATLRDLDNAIGMLTPDDKQDAEMAAAITRDKAAGRPLPERPVQSGPPRLRLVGGP